MVTVSNLVSWHLLPNSLLYWHKRVSSTEHLGRMIAHGVGSWPMNSSQSYTFYPLPSFSRWFWQFPQLLSCSRLVKKFPVTIFQSLKKEEWIKSLERRKGFELKTQPNHFGEHRLFTGDLGKWGSPGDLTAGWQISEWVRKFSSSSVENLARHYSIKLPICSLQLVQTREALLLCGDKPQIWNKADWHAYLGLAGLRFSLLLQDCIAKEEWESNCIRHSSHSLKMDRMCGMNWESPTLWKLLFILHYLFFVPFLID